MRRLSAVALLLVGAAAALPTAAGAHARLVRTEPSGGTVLAQPPAAVRVVFDDAVRPGSGIAAVRNEGGSVLAGTPRVVSGSRVLVIPLRPRLADGDYTVRWRVVSDDGHELGGVFAFGVGVGRPAPAPVLAADNGVRPRDLVSRWLFFAGLMAAAGSVAFRLLVWRGALDAVAPPPEARGRAARNELQSSSGLLFAGFLLAFLGASTASHAGLETRFGLVNGVAALEAAVGAALAALTYGGARRRLSIPAAVLAIALLPMPTIAGHALDRDQSVLAPVFDVVHIGSAAVWLGALLSLAVVVARVAPAFPPEERAALYGQVARRMSRVIVLSVALISLTGALRALGELSAVEQVWTTGYGRVIVAKTVLLGLLLAVGWQNRYRLIPRLTGAAGAGRTAEAGRLVGRLRRNVVAELGGFTALVAAVALLTDLPPGRTAGLEAASAVRSRQTPQRVPLPPQGALLLGGQARELAVALAARPAGGTRIALTATVIGQDGSGVSGLDVGFSVDGRVEAPGEACGQGCYATTLPDAGRPRLVTVRLQGNRRRASTVAFRLSERWPAPSAASLVRRAERAFRSLRSVSLVEELESQPGHRIVSEFRFVAPDRLSYRIEGGAEAVLIGNRRWDRAQARGLWSASPQQPVSVPAAPWTTARDPHLLRTEVFRGRRVFLVSFLDPAAPAWFTAWIEPKTGRTLRVRMTAAAHFMRERYSGFDAPLEIRPPNASKAP